MKKNQNGAPAMRETKKDSRRKFQRIASMMIVGLLLISGFAFAENGKINLIFTNGSILTSNTEKYYEFDVQAYMSNGSDVIADGMVYVEYPQDVFNNLVVSNDKVTVTKAGILSGTDPILNLDLYRLVNITDTYQNTFAITFESSFSASAPSMKAYYQAVSTDPENPSDLLHISIQLSQEVDGSICFPATIPGLDYLYYDYEGETFSEGLNIDEAYEMIESNPVITDPVVDPVVDPVIDPVVDPDPVFAGVVELASFKTSLKKAIVDIKWTTILETNIEEFIIERSENDVDYSEIMRESAAGTSTKRVRYEAKDYSVVPGITYNYRLLAVDTEGNMEVVKMGASKTSGEIQGNYYYADHVFELGASYPNPFNPSFTVPFTLENGNSVDIKLYDMSGKVVAEIASGYHSAGSYSVYVNCDHLGSGVYLLRSLVNGSQNTQKMLLVK
jgi:type IX secretion system substrate protein